MENLTHAHGVLPSAPVALCASCAVQAGNFILIPAIPCENIVTLQEVEEFEKLLIALAVMVAGVGGLYWAFPTLFFVILLQYHLHNRVSCRGYQAAYVGDD